MNPLFSPDSTYWRVNREWLIALAGPCAVLLELAHPAVAAGVARHSNYRGDPFGRLYRTMKTMTEISFGTAAERQNALKHFHRCHAPVRGVIEAGTEQYDARDPKLQFWVLATLIDSVPRAYERFVAPLTREEQEGYYEDCAKLARVMGIKQEAVPVTFSEFQIYMREMLEGDALRVTGEGRAVADALFAPTLRGNTTRLYSFASIGMLPPRLRQEFGFTWDQASEERLERFARWSRRIRPRVPNLLAVHPKAYVMERKIRVGTG
jgi:uncharacterized protein (DUF2236 family)